MPLVAAGFLALLAGLLLGLELPLGVVRAREVTTLVGMASIAALALRGRGHAPASALVLLGVAGLLVGAAEHARERRCRERAAGAQRWSVILGAHAEPGSYVRARLDEGNGCRLRVALSVREGEAPSGARVEVRGSPVRVSGAVAFRVQRASLTRLPGGSTLGRLRGAVRDRVALVFGADDGLAAALLVADTHGIPGELRERFADAGLVHLLAISGLHVGIIAAAAELLARAARLSRRRAVVIGAAAAAVYVAILGFPAPAMRAGTMLAVGAASRLLQRPTSPWASLAVGAALPVLVHPAVVRELGYQLSAGGIAGLIAAAALERRWLRPRRLHPWVRAGLSSLLASTAASVVTAPLVAWHFGRLSLIGPVANLLAGPLVAVLQPTLFLALLVSPLLGVAHFVAGAAGLLLRALTLVAGVAAALPGAAVDVAPSTATAILCAAAVAAAIVASVSRFPARPMLAGMLALTLAVWRPLLPRARGELELHMLDVGQGDAVAVRTPGGRWLLFDAGRVWQGGDAGRRTVVPYLRRRGGRLEAFVLSHPHADHVGGASAVLRMLRPRHYWDAAYAEPSEVYRRSLNDAGAHGVAWRRVHPGDSLVLDGVVARVLAPDSAWTAGLRDANLASTVVTVEHGAVRFLLTGDAEAPLERWLLARSPGELRADVLKVAHHGSATSTLPEFVAAVRPRVALISVGAGNLYGHPNAAVVGRLLDAGAQVLRTDQLGTIVVRSDGRTLTLQAAGERWVLSASSTR